MWEWLLAPIDASRPHDVSFEVAWHGRVMFLAWSILVPIGIFSARFFKVLPRQNWPETLDNQLWWYTHQVAQYIAGLLTLTGIWLIWDVSGTREGGFFHHLMGWTTVTLCGVQYIAGWTRGSKGGPTEVKRTGTIRGDHYDMTPRRIFFEYLHKTTGYACLTIALCAIGTGLWVANAPHWMWLTIGMWWAFVIVAFVRFHKIFEVLDTYQAIWGNNPDLPGNKLKPIGFGIKKRD